MNTGTPASAPADSACTTNAAAATTGAAFVGHCSAEAPSQRGRQRDCRH